VVMDFFTRHGGRQAAATARATTAG
jgi:hypothetical protein